MGSTGSPPQENEDSLICSGRHKHGLFFREELAPYTCSGCKEYGANMGYKCDSCPDFVLHKVCASLPDEYVHPLHTEHHLRFRAKTRLRHHCDACGDVVRGFVFESRRAHLRLHPLCMALPAVINYGGHPLHSLKLVAEKGAKFSCSQCSQTNSCWRYRCEDTACGLNVDMNCVKVDSHRLSEHGINASARRSRSRRVKENMSRSGRSLSRSGRYVVGKVVEGAVSGIVSAALDLD